MDISDARRQVVEINALQGQSKFSHAIEVITPALFNRLERAVGKAFVNAHTILARNDVICGFHSLVLTDEHK